MFSAPERLGFSFPRMEEEMENLMQRLFNGEEEGWTLARPFAPRVNLAETETEYEATFELPGLKPEEVKVEWKDGELWISGKTEEKKEEKGKTYHRIERRFGEFRRVLPLPAAIKEEEINAKFENGVLRVVVPKSEVVKPKQIEVKA